jgi:hypothetical protein
MTEFVFVWPVVVVLVFAIVAALHELARKVCADEDTD